MTDTTPTPRPEAFRYFALPRASSPETLQLLVARYKAFRLLSLRLSPECFGSTHAREAAFPPETWVSRITNPGATNIVAIAAGPGREPVSGPEPVTVPLLSGEWLASLTLLGPFEPYAALDMFKAQMPLDPSIVDFGDIEADVTRTHFVLVAMYVVPEARGRGAGRGILGFAKDAARERGGGGPVRLLLLVDHDNEAARRAYERAGFVTVHRYWFDDERVGRGSRTEAAVMSLDL